MVIRRLIDAPRERVFEAWTRPEYLAAWWGPIGFTTTTSAFEFRPGGVWRFVMHGPDGVDYENRIIFDEITLNERIAYRHDDGGDVEDVKFTSVITFVSEAGKTRLTMSAEFATVEEYERVMREYGAEEGGRQTTARLATYLADKDNAVFDLVIDREVAAPVELLWRCWTEPEHLAKWWAPAPLTTEVRALDVWPGGAFSSVMRTPEGQEYPGEGVFLEVVPHKRIVFTDTLLPGWRPAASPFFTAIIEMSPSAKGTRYVARAIHRNKEDRDKHEAMGFFDGWGTVIGQLERVAQSLRS